MSEAYRVVREKSQVSAQKGKSGYDRKVFGAVLEVGDRVLVRNLSERGGTGKLRSHWEEKVHKVIQKMKDVPVYKVTPEDGSGKTRVLHRNLLLPCDFLPSEEPVGMADLKNNLDAEKAVTQEPEKEKPKSQRKKVTEEKVKEDSSDESDEEISWLVRLKAVTDKIEAEEISGLEVAEEDRHVLSGARDEDEDISLVADREDNPVVVESEHGDSVGNSSDDDVSSADGDVPIAYDDETALAVLSDTDDPVQHHFRRGERCSTRPKAPRKVFEYRELGKPSYRR